MNVEPLVKYQAPVAMPPARPAADDACVAEASWVALVAHDLNNLLQAASAAVCLARQGGGLQLLDVAESALRRGAQMARTLVGGGPAEARGLLDPAELALSMRGLLAQAAAPRVSVRVEARPGGGQVHADRQALERALLNLVVNAREACADGGQIRIRSGTRRVPPDVRPGARRSGRYLTLEVADNGSGITPALCARLFEPHVTTRAGQGGHGLGLAQVRAAVQQAGGFVEVVSTPGEGARFVLALPLADAVA
jgi:signal transduction histidine kinase